MDHAIDAAAAVGLDGDDASLAEDREVAADEGLRQAEARREITDAAAVVDQTAHDPQPYRVSEGFEQARRVGQGRGVQLLGVG